MALTEEGARSRLEESRSRPELRLSGKTVASLGNWSEAARDRFQGRRPLAERRPVSHPSTQRCFVYVRAVTSSEDALARLRAAIAKLEPGEDRPPTQDGDFWVELLRITLDGWAEALERDQRRADAALAAAAEVQDEAPSDDQVAALEECLWRLASATDKVDAIVSLAFAGEPFEVVADERKKITMRPSRDRNKAALKTVGAEATDRLVEERARLAGERSRLRRHQLAHSLAPLAALADLGVFIRVHHRDGRIFGYETCRWSPERWEEGIKELQPETLFARRIEEARRGLQALGRVVDALETALRDQPIALVPQYVYYDHDTGTQSTTRPEPSAPPKSFEIDFVLDGTEPPVWRRVSSPSLMFPGVEIPFDDGLWRVIRTEAGDGGAGQTAICRLVEGDD